MTVKDITYHKQINLTIEHMIGWWPNALPTGLVPVSWPRVCILVSTDPCCILISTVIVVVISTWQNRSRLEVNSTELVK